MLALPYSFPLRNADFHSLLQEISNFCSASGGQPLRIDQARIELLTGGRSDVAVLQVSFPMPDDDVLRFVLRVHGAAMESDAEAVRQEYTKELNTLRRLERSAKKYISREFLNAEFRLHVADGRPPLPVVVLRHASDRQGRGTSLEALDVLVAHLIESEDVDSAKMLANVIAKAKPEVDLDWRKMDDYDLPAVESGTELARKAAGATLPDLIVDLEECAMRDGCLLLGDQFAILETTTFEDIESACKHVSTVNLLELNRNSPVCVRATLVVHERSDDGKAQYVHCHLKDGAIGLVVRGEARSTLLGECRSGTFRGPTKLVIPRGALMTCESHLAGRGISADAVIPHRLLTELIATRRYYVTNASHADLHCGNVLADANTLMVIDFYNPKFRPVHSDWARLSTSLVAKLESRLSDKGRALLPYDCPWPTPNVNAKEDAIGPLETILRALAARRTYPDDHDTLLAYALEASRFLRYVLEGTLGASRFLDCWCTFWKEHLLAALKRSRAENNSDQQADTLYDLWDRALRSVAIPGHGIQARRVLRAVAAAIGPRVSDGLTDLQRTYVKHERFESRDTAHLLILGPTSTGKSTIAQVELVRHLLAAPDADRPCCIYIAPTKALTHAVYREIQSLLTTAGIIDESGTEVIVSTGDERQHDYALSNGRFKIACVVNEKANAVISRSPHLLSRVGLLVVDELHMIQEPQRGPVLETLLMKLRSELQKGRSTQQSRWSTSISPRLIGISTEQRGSALPKFFTAIDDVGSPVKPIVVHAPGRPIAVRHSLVFRADGDSSDDSFRLSIESIVDVTGDRRRYLNENELRLIEHKLNQRIKLTTSSLRLQDQRGQRNSITIDLCKRLLTRSPLGRTILVFTSSIRECGDIARKLAQWRSEQGFSRPGESNADPNQIRFEEAIDEIESRDEAEDLRRFAKFEVYVHNSEIRNSVRTVIEDLFRKAGNESPSRVLVATTTLAYGVNLAVTDVILEHTHFPSSTRTPPAETSILDNFTSVERIEPVEFHNMAGRAGRLGYRRENDRETGDDVANFFVIVPRGVDPIQEIVFPYYSLRASTLQSVLFAREDIKPLSRLDAEAKSGWLAQALRREVSDRDLGGNLGSHHFSFPFARSVLDIARHLCYSNVRVGRTASNPLKPVTKEDVCEFIGLYSLLSHDNTQPSARERRERDARYLVTAVEAILRDSETLGLLEKSDAADSRSSSSYLIRPIGESMLETGTEFAAVIPLIQLTKVIGDAWADFCDRAGVAIYGPPTEAYILALVFQEDVCRRHRTAIPEWRWGRNDEQWGEAQQEANQGFVHREVANALVRIAPLIESKAEALVTVLRRHLNQWLRDNLFRSIPLAYDFAPVDGGLRFFTSMVRWINGDRTDDCKNVLTREFDRNGVERKGQPFFGFADYVSRLSYRARFLAALSLNEKQNQGVGTTGAPLQLERELIRLSERLVHGCIASAISLFWPRSSDLPRSKGRELLEKGLTATRIVRDGVPKDVRDELGIPDDRGDQLVVDISRYAASQLDRLWVESRPREIRAEAAVVVVEAIERWVRSILDLMNDAPRSRVVHRRGGEILREFRAASALVVRDQLAELERPSDADLEGADDDRPIVMFESVREIDCGTICAGNVLRQNSAGLDGHDRVLALISTPCQSAEGARAACQRALNELEDDESIRRLSAMCCVIWPWGSTEEFYGSRTNLATRTHDTVNVFFLTPLGFCALVAFIIRALYSPSRLFEIAQRAQGELVTVSRLIDEFGLLNNKEVPSALRQDLLAVFEVA